MKRTGEDERAAVERSARTLRERLQRHATAGAKKSKPELAAPIVTRKLDLACGQSPAEGFEGVDIWLGAQHVVDLMRYPWPFEDNSVAELRCSHFIEHIPMIYVLSDGGEISMGHPRSQDALFRFFDECYRVLVPDGFMTVIAPSARSNRGYQDPTHRRFIVETTFAYLQADWRFMNKLDHYNVICDFEANVQQMIADPAINTMAPEVAQRYLNQYWNTTVDFVAKLKARKPGLTKEQYEDSLKPKPSGTFAAPVK